MMRGEERGPYARTFALRSGVRRQPIVGRRLVCAAVLAPILFLSACVGGSDAPSRPPVDRPAVDASRAFGFLRQQVEFGPRIPGSDGHAAQLAWMLELLEASADTVWTDSFEYTTTEGDELPLTNVLARFRGTAEGRRVMVLAHWDTRPKADRSRDIRDQGRPVPGANDAASGTAALLELAELFSEQRPPITVDLLFVDGEDYGPSTDDMFIGSKRFAETVTPEWRPTYGILLDMVADQSPRFPVEGYSSEYAPQIVQKVWTTAHDLGYRAEFPLSVGQRILDDHLPLNEAGIQTIDIIDFDYGPGNSFWHTPLDVIENTSGETLRMVIDVVAEVIYRGG